MLPGGDQLAAHTRRVRCCDEFLTDDHSVCPGTGITHQIPRRPDPGQRDPDGSTRKTWGYLRESLPVDGECVEIPGIDTNDPRTGLNGPGRLLRSSNLYHRSHPQGLNTIKQRFQMCLLQSPDLQRDHIRAIVPGFVYLVRIDHEVTAHHGNCHRSANGTDIL